MSKYIDAEKLTKAIEEKGLDCSFALKMERLDILALIDELQQDDTQVDRMLCSQIWWEEQGWIMIPPGVTIEGIDSLLKQVRKKLQQEQPQVADASKMDSLEYWLRQFGMPEENIENCITQIAQGYGACRYLEGIQLGAEAVNELAKQVQPEVDLDKALDEYYKNADFGPSEAIEYEIHKDIARHFFELGKVLNARKEE